MRKSIKRFSYLFYSNLPSFLPLLSPKSSKVYIEVRVREEHGKIKKEKNWEKFLLNPVEFSALAHLKFVTIHPFTDGNGRISRLISNYALYKNKFPMFIKKYINSNKEYLQK